MKSLIVSAFLLLFVAQATLVAKWETLNGDVYQSSYIRTLRDAGVSYVKQEGIFENTKVPLPGKDYMIPFDSYATIERRNASDWTYYRFNLSLVEGYFSDRASSLVKTSFIVSSKPSNGNFIVTFYRYTVDPHGNPPFDGEADSDGEYDLLDVRSLNNGTSPYTNTLNKARDSIVAQAIKNGDFPNSHYRIIYVYDAYSIIYYSEGYSELRYNVKLVNSEGKYFYVEIVGDNYGPLGGGDGEEDFSFSYNILIRPGDKYVS